MIKAGSAVVYQVGDTKGVGMVLKVGTDSASIINHNMSPLVIAMDRMEEIKLDLSGIDIFEACDEMKSYLRTLVKPTITIGEKNLLSVLECDAYVVRNKGGKVVVHAEKPEKKTTYWISDGNYIELRQGAFINLEFAAVRWEDEEPWLVSDLYNLEVK